MKLVWVVMKSFETSWPEEVMVIERSPNGDIKIIDRNGLVEVVREAFKTLRELGHRHPEVRNPIYFDINNRTMEI